MWCPTQARRSLATQKVLLSSAPHARSGRVSIGSATTARDVSARPTQHHGPRGLSRDAHHRVVGPGLDGPVVHQEQVGDPTQSLDAHRHRGRRSARRRRCRWSSRAGRRRRRAEDDAVVNTEASARACVEPGATPEATSRVSQSPRQHDRAHTRNEQHRFFRRRDRPAHAPSPDRAPSARTAFPPGASSPGGAPPPPRRPLCRPDGTRRFPSPPRPRRDRSPAPPPPRRRGRPMPRARRRHR